MIDTERKSYLADLVEEYAEVFAMARRRLTKLLAINPKGALDPDARPTTEEVQRCVQTLVEMEARDIQQELLDLSTAQAQALAMMNEGDLDEATEEGEEPPSWERKPLRLVAEPKDADAPTFRALKDEDVTI